MNGPKRTWEDLHHHSYFLPKLQRIESDEFRSTLSENVGCPMVPLGIHGIYAEGNMMNLSPTIPIDISQTPRNIENVYMGADCSPDEVDEYTKIFK